MLVAGDHEVNEVKLKNINGGEMPELASPEVIQQPRATPVGFAGRLA